jgi:hypothetical protein
VGALETEAIAFDFSDFDFCMILRSGKERVANFTPNPPEPTLLPAF